MLVALASATAIAILLPAGPDDGCPSPRQVSQAVSAHLPGVVLPLGRAPGPIALRLSVTTDGAGTLRVDLSDAEGGALLRRRVAPASGARIQAADCVALAETAALIVDRYWHEVGYEVPSAAPAVAPKPPPPAPAPPAQSTAPPVPPAAAPAAASPKPPAAETDERPLPERPPERPRGPLHPPDWWLAVGISGSAGDRGPLQAAASLAGAVERTVRGRRLGLRLSVGSRYPNVVPSPASDNPAAGQATIVQVPIAIDVYLGFPVGRGRLEPGLGADVNVVFATSTQGTRETRTRAAPAVDALLAWTIPLAHDIFVRTMAAGGVGFLVTVFDDAHRLKIFETPRLRAELGLELGVWFY